MLKGNNLILSINGTPLGASRTCDISRKVSTIPVCPPKAGAARRYITSTTEWTIASDGLYANKEAANRLRDIWRAHQKGNGSPLLVQISLNGEQEQGEAILTDLKERGDHNSLVKFSIALQGSGNLYGVKHVPTQSGLQDRQLSFEGTDYIIYNNVPGVTVQYTDLYAPANSIIIIDCDGDPTKWAICRGRYSDYEQDIDNNYEISFVTRGESNARFEISTPGYYCILSDDDSQEPIVSVLQ